MSSSNNRAVENNSDGGAMPKFLPMPFEIIEDPN